MKALSIISLLIAMVLSALNSINAHAADVVLSFDPVDGATGYRIEMSQDLGITWGMSQDTVGMTTHTFTGAPEDSLLLFRVAAYNDVQESVRTYSGAWYDHRLVPMDSPSGAGIQ